MTTDFRNRFAWQVFIRGIATPSVGLNSYLSSPTKWQKNKVAKNEHARNYLPPFQTAIFLPLYLFAILLVAAEGRAG
jgi:hypothetical protein